VLNKLWAYLPGILYSQVLVKKIQEGKHQEKTVYLEARNGKHLPSRETERQIFLLEVRTRSPYCSGYTNVYRQEAGD